MYSHTTQTVHLCHRCIGTHWCNAAVFSETSVRLSPMWASWLCCRGSPPLCSCSESSPAPPRTFCPPPAPRTRSARLHLGPKYLKGGGGPVSEGWVWRRWFTQLLLSHAYHETSCPESSVIISSPPPSVGHKHSSSLRLLPVTSSSSMLEENSYLREFDEGGNVCYLWAEKRNESWIVALHQTLAHLAAHANIITASYVYDELHVDRCWLKTLIQSESKVWTHFGFYLKLNGKLNT